MSSDSSSSDDIIESTPPLATPSSRRFLSKASDCLANTFRKLHTDSNLNNQVQTVSRADIIRTADQKFQTVLHDLCSESDDSDNGDITDDRSEFSDDIENKEQLAMPHSTDNVSDTLEKSDDSVCDLSSDNVENQIPSHIRSNNSSSKEQTAERKELNVVETKQSVRPKTSPVHTKDDSVCIVEDDPNSNATESPKPTEASQADDEVNKKLAILQKFGSSLADGGAKLRSQIEECRKQQNSKKPVTSQSDKGPDLSKDLERTIEKQRILRQQLSLVKTGSREGYALSIEIANCNQHIADLKVRIARARLSTANSSGSIRPVTHSNPSGPMRQPSLAQAFSAVQLSQTQTGKGKAFSAWRDANSVIGDDLSSSLDRPEDREKLYGGKMTDDRRCRVVSVTQDALRSLSDTLKSMPNETDLAPSRVSGLRTSVNLFDHQRRALTWLEWREHQRTGSGGILADDMGLGKTLTMISLVLQTRVEDVGSSSAQSGDSGSAEWLSKSKAQNRIGSKATLVICPASLMGQWQGEIERRVKSAVLASHIYHGANRYSKGRSAVRTLANYDVVITTYGTVLSEGKLFGLGSARLEDFLPADDENRTSDGGSGCPLFDIAWRRIILDEGHQIRNPRSQTSKAVCLLAASSRWIVTGTPIQNKSLDLYAMIRFLRLTPFDQYKVWKLWVDNSTPSGEARLKTVVKCILLRRSKSDKQSGDPSKPLVDLPLKTELTHEIDLSSGERRVYDEVFSQSKQAVLDYIGKSRGNASSGTERRPQVRIHRILVMLLRLRQICCHPGLATGILSDDDKKEIEYESGDRVDQKNGDPFDVIAGRLANMSLANAADGHNNEEQGKTEGQKEDDEGRDNILVKSNPVFDLSRPSSKIESLIAKLDEALSNNTDKAVVVSQWTSVLDVVSELIQTRLHLRCFEISGRVAVKDRSCIVDDFNRQCKSSSISSQSRVMLLSLAAGGVGLNLVGANHLFLVDCSWNPQLERQACDRIYRVGQTKETMIHKFVVKDTIEKRIVDLQKQKMELAEGVLTGAQQAQKLTFDDLKTLFGVNSR